MTQFPFPSPPGSVEVPLWTGAGFRLGDRSVAVLEYSKNEAGWSDDLTKLHEEAAGDSHPAALRPRQGPLPSESCDAVVMLNVLEHIAHDAGALAQTHRILKPGGVAQSGSSGDE